MSGARSEIRCAKFGLASRFLLIVSVLATVEVGGLLVAVGLDRDAIMTGTMKWRLLSSLVVSVVAVALTWISIRRIIERPIQSLVATAARWQRGDWAARASAHTGLTEFDRLAVALDTMADAISAREGDLQKAHEALRKSEEHLARAQRIGATGSWEYDFRSRRLDLSDEIYRMLGLTRENGTTIEAIDNIVLEEDRPTREESNCLLLAGNRQPPLEFRIRRPDGQIRHLYRETEPRFDQSGAVVGFVGVTHDVTEMRENERRLLRSREHLARAQRVAATGSFEVDLSTGQIECSDETYRIFGIDRNAGSLTLAEIESRVIPEDRAAARRAFEDARSGVRGVMPEYRIRRPDGAIRTIYREVDAMFDASGKQSGIIGVIKDVTELREAERKRDEFQLQLLHAQKLDAIGTLAGGIAHDLNNTLLPVIALSTLSMKTTPPGSRNHESLEVIHQAGVRARDLVHRILTFARKTEPTRSPIDLGASTAAAVKLLRATLPSLIKIHERVERVPRILADETQIHQIIINLATNAAQAIGGQMGTITVQVAPAISSADSSPAVRLSVIDTGCGMDAATRSRIFEPFFTTKSTGEGTGLGLSVVNGIVTAHGAAISVESELGKGTRFDILFPAATEGGS